MREPISLKLEWSNFTTPPMCLRGAVAMATLIVLQQRSQSSIAYFLEGKIVVATWHHPRTRCELVAI